MAEPVPARVRPAHDTQPVISLERAVRIAPVFAGHLAAAAGRKQAPLGVGRQLREETRDVGGGRGKTRGRRDRIGQIVAGNDKTAADRKPQRVTACERDALGQRHVGLGLAQACGSDDLALDPAGIRFARNRFDHEAQQSKSVVGIFEARVGRDDRRQLQVRHQLLRTEIRPAIAELSSVGAVAGETGAVRKQLRDRGLRDLRMQAFHVLPDRIIQPQFALLAQLHDSG